MYTAEISEKTVAVMQRVWGKAKDLSRDSARAVENGGGWRGKAGKGG